MAMVRLHGLGRRLGGLLRRDSLDIRFLGIGAPAADPADQLIGLAPVVQRLLSKTLVGLERRLIVQGWRSGLGVQRVG